MNEPIIIDNVLSETDLEQVQALLATRSWVNGQETVGEIAVSVKRNQQVSTNDDKQLQTIVRDALKAAPLFQALVMPTDVGLMFSRYNEGDHYGRHVDSALMGHARRDVSFTIAVTDEASYSGGNLVIETQFDSRKSYRIKRGSMLVYPATFLHEVEPIEVGVRDVVVGWARSRVRDPAQRAMLFELTVVRGALFHNHGKTAEVDLLSKTLQNLMRMWVDD